MNIEATPLPGVLLIRPVVHEDARGFFLETYRADAYAEALGLDGPFVQNNHSGSNRGVLRGLHCQLRRPQGKLIRCLGGEIFDVAVDIDPHSATFGRWFGQALSSRNHLQMYVPPGHAHGFQVLSARAEVEYLCTDYYDPGGEVGLAWNAPDVGIEWPLGEPLLSDKDRALPGLAQFRTGA